MHMQKNPLHFIGLEAPVMEEGGVKRSMLNAVTVHKDHRRKGLARILISQILEEAKQQRVNVLRLLTVQESMEPAWKLYEQFGFSRIKEEVFREEPRKMTVLTYQLRL